MKSVFIRVLTLSLVVFLAGCAVFTAKQTYRADGGDEMMITGRVQGGQVAIYINGEEVIGKTSMFKESMSGMYGENKVVAMCKHVSHWASVENECDIYINNRFAVNLYMR